MDRRVIEALRRFKEQKPKIKLAISRIATKYALDLMGLRPEHDKEVMVSVHRIMIKNLEAIERHRKRTGTVSDASLDIFSKSAVVELVNVFVEQGKAIEFINNYVSKQSALHKAAVRKK